MKKSSIGLAIVSLVFAALASVGAGHAADCGQGGSPKNSAGSCETSDNQVHCGPGQATPVGTISVSNNGAEVCNDGSTSPVQGRVGAEGPNCDCVYADGDADNSNDQIQGWARIDQKGLSCDDARQPSYNSGPGAACG